MEPRISRRSRKAEEDLSPAYLRRLRQRDLAVRREDQRQEILLHQRNIRDPVIDHLNVHNNNNNNDNDNGEPLPLIQPVNDPPPEDIQDQQVPVNDAIDNESLGSDRSDALIVNK